MHFNKIVLKCYFTELKKKCCLHVKTKRNFNSFVLGSSDKEQITQCNQIECSKEIRETVAGYRIRLKVFTGAFPARKCEGRRQRGGNYSCLCGANVTDHQNLNKMLQD